jgi:tetratricopeptide (TPR) repeat protein
MPAAAKRRAIAMRTFLILACSLGLDLSGAAASAATDDGLQVLSNEELVVALQQALGPEAALVPPPFLADGRVTVWARELTRGCQTDEQRARALHDALAPLRSAHGRGRTALEVLEQRTTETDGFGPSELARLYVALARSIALRAVCVDATADPIGRSMSEICAGVSLGGRIVLVDPGFQAAFDAPVRLPDGSVQKRRVMRIFVSYDIKHRTARPLTDLESAAAFCGERALLLRDADDAIRLASLGTRLAPDLALAHAQLAQVELHHARAAEALDSAARAVELEPENAVYRVLLADVHLALGHLQDADAELMQAVELDQHCFDALAKLGWVRYLRGDYDASADSSSRAVAVDPERPPALTTLALALLCAGRTQPAVDAYETAIKTYGQDDLLGAASELAEAMLSREPAAGRYCLGLLYEATGFATEARSSFRAYLNRWPNGTFAEDALARLYRLAGTSRPVR